MKNCFDRTPHTMKDWLLLAAGVAFNIVQEDVGKLLFFLCQAGKGLMQFSFCLF